MMSSSYREPQVAHGSVVAWQHINLLGENDFSEEKLQDTVGIRPPILTS